MTRLLDTVNKLQKTNAVIRNLQDAVAKHPDTPSLVVNLRSLERRRRDLEMLFGRLTHEDLEDVCSYRIFSDREDGRIPISSLASALVDFQALFSTVYDAIKNGARHRIRHRPEIAAATTFEYGYSFAGSAGFVFTLPNERLLLGGTDLDRAIDTIFEMAQAKESDQILRFTKRLGAAPVRLLYNWATGHVEAGLSADIDWRRDQHVRFNLLIQTPELEVLQRAISQTSEETREVFTVEGQLVGADVEGHRFHMKLSDGPDIRGQMSDYISAERTVELPRQYVAQIEKTTVVRYSTNQEKVTYHLLSLRD